MKKQLVASLAAAMVLGVAGTSFAAANPFADVPAKHWSYDAVTKLAQAGIVDGYSNGQFQGDKMISRYEMAQIVAKAMAHSDKADASQKAAIDKLAVEFASELEGLNVRMSKVEAKQDNVKWGGEVRERYDSVKSDTSNRQNNNSHSYVDMWATAQINQDWVGKAEYESTKKLENGTNGTNDSFGTTRVYAEGTLAGGKATIGKFNPFVGYGLVIDDNMTGAQYQFGNELKARVGYGKYSGNFNTGGGYTNPAPVGTFANDPTYGFAELDYATSKVTNLKVAYQSLGKLKIAGNALTGTQDSVHYSEIGFDTKLAADWSLMGTYAKSNLTFNNADNKAYFTQITYKGADIKKEGSYDIYANYRKIPVAAQIDSTWDYSAGVKGVQVGFNYVPATNIKLGAFYLAGKDISNTAGVVANNNVKIYRAQAEFFF
jgi:hypothetical protein